MPTATPKPTTKTHRYITTAIPYVNGAPHVGFALEMVQADVLARFYRQSGNDVRFQAGTDENSIKNVQAAEVAGVPLAEFVERNAARFLALKQGLNLSVDDFIRTSTDVRHRQGAERLWMACWDSGDIYKRAYRGLYCTGCEQFYKPDELDAGRCAEHGTVPEEVEEENWFFRLSRYQQRLRGLYVSGAIDIVPAARRNEILAWIESGLEDISISRSAVRARGWGISVPNDPQQVIYVWFDALANYITALGYGADAPLLDRYWTHAASREHVIGKGITRFHAVYWPAMLLSVGLPVPTRLLVHGYLTVGGRKIGKSAGNAIAPDALASEFGVDALRYYLLRHFRPAEDGDFSVGRFRQAYATDLADQLGNLAHRVLAMIDRYCGGIVPAPPAGFVADDRLLRSATGLGERVADHVRAFAFNHALDAIWALVGAANRYVSDEKPWALARDVSPSRHLDGAQEPTAHLHGVLFSLATALRTIAACLAPLLPETSLNLAAKLGAADSLADPFDVTALVGCRVTMGTPLFPKLQASAAETGDTSERPGR